MRYAKPLSLYREVLKLDAWKQGRVLGVSIGADSYRDHCVGVAASDLHGELVEPCCVFDTTEHDISHISSRLHDMITRRSVYCLIVGYPKGKQHVLNVKLFVEDLSITGNLKIVPYTFWREEDLYAKRIQFIEDPFSFDPIAAKRLSDKKHAASGMLQDYLDTMKKEVAEVSE